MAEADIDVEAGLNGLTSYDPAAPIGGRERAVQEDCDVCGTTVPLSVTTHVILNPSGDEGVRDYYVCKDCYEAHFEGLFAEPAESEE